MARLVAVSRAEGAAREIDLDWPALVATVHRQMRSVVGPGRDLEDLTQTALEQVIRGIERYEGRAALSTFTYRICAHVAMNHWRWWRRWLKKFELGLEGRPDLPTSDGVARGSDLAVERARRLHRALERLHPLRRVTLTLIDLEGKTAAAVAEILECPEPTVRSRLRQARIELAAILRKDPYFEGGEP